MRYLKQSTAATVLLGPAVDASDGVVPEEGLSPTVYLSKAGAAQAARNDATAIAHDRDGYYRVPLDATDTGTVGPLRAQFSASGTHAPVWEDFHVLTAAAYDALFGGSAAPSTFDASADEVTTDSASRTASQADVSSLLTAAAFNAALPSNFDSLLITASGHVSRVVLVDTTTTNADMVGTDGAYTGTPPTVAEIRDVIPLYLARPDGSGGWEFAAFAGPAIGETAALTDAADAAVSDPRDGRKVGAAS